LLSGRKICSAANNAGGNDFLGEKDPAGKTFSSTFHRRKLKQASGIEKVEEKR
jgi:hypothetical protein